jgi:hypothetical protein
MTSVQVAIPARPAPTDTDEHPLRKRMRYRSVICTLFRQYNITVSVDAFWCGSAIIYKNQLEAACDAFTIFKTREQLYVMLIGLMQSGKTGAFHALIRLMLLSGLVRRTYILCGSAEVGLREQAEGDAKSYNPEFYRSGALRVCFHQTFAKLTMNTSNSLIVIDESHMNQNTDGHIGQMDLMLRRHNIALTGTHPILARNNTYIVSVSATPFSEYSDMVHNVGNKGDEEEKKAVVRIRPGVGYRGIKEFRAAGKIVSTGRFNLEEDPAKFFEELIGSGNKYALMRINDNNVKRIISTRAPSFGIKVLHHTRKRNDILISRDSDNPTRRCLEDEPCQPTIVLFAGKLRCGKVVPMDAKKHISCVWEDSPTADTDTVLQGLAGRMCGYYPSGSTLPYVYVPSALLATSEYKFRIGTTPVPRCISVDEFDRFTLGFEGRHEGYIMPTKFKNAGSLIVRGQSDRLPALPLRYEPAALFNAEQLHMFELARGEKTAMFRFLRTNARLLAPTVIANFTAAPEYTPEQKLEVVEFFEQGKLPKHELATRWVDTITQPKWRRDLHESVRVRRMLTTHAIQGKKKKEKYQPFFGLAYDDVTNHVFAIFQFAPPAGVTHIDKLIRRTTGIEIFARAFADEDAEIPEGEGVVISRLRPDSTTNPAVFEAGLQEFVSRSINGPVADSNFIGGPITFSKAAYGWVGGLVFIGGKLTPPPIMLAILRRIGDAHGVSIKLSYTEDTKHATGISPDHFQVSCVSWIKK